jgi:deoxyribodipyrimidine photo-lyase
MTTGIWWIRRDLRLDDNPALQEAITHSDHLIPLFILDPTILSHPAEKRKSFLFDGLRALDASLRRQGSQLIVRQGEPQQVIAEVFETSGASAVYAEADYSPYARKRDHAVAARFPLWLVHGLTVFPPGLIQKSTGAPYTVYTYFNRAWKNLPVPAPCCNVDEFRMPPLPAKIPTSQAIPAATAHHLALQAGEQAAFAQLQHFLAGPISRYGQDRDLLAADATSMLAPYLRFGMLSIRGLVAEARYLMENAADETTRQNAALWLDQFIWRDFYFSILHYFPQVLKTSFRRDLHNIQWRHAPADLEAWKQGQTGYPVVDAGMRQLRQTGWIHTRARVITASFLVKDLLINWQDGEAWFMEQMLDGDPALNNGGWQRAAGVGTDAVPFFRIFNPTQQGRKFDPAGEYIRRWVPELARVPDKFIHQPWLMPAEVQQLAGCVVGVNYPKPIVDHRQIKERTLQAYHTGQKYQVLSSRG